MTPGSIAPNLPPLAAPPEAMISPVPALQVKRTDDDTPDGRAALVKKWQGKVIRSRGVFDKIFKQMGKDQRFLRGKQWGDEPEDETKYVANITQRLINQKVSALYAKDPTFIARRKKQLDFKIWDGERSSLAPLQAIISPQPQPIPGPGGQPLIDPHTGMPVMGPPPPPDPNAVALMLDVQQGLAKRFLMNRIAGTLEIVFAHEIDEQIPPFKKQMKQMVRRTCTNSVGYVKIGYQRFLERRPEDADRVTDITQRIADIASKEADVLEGDIDENSAEMEQLRIELEALQDNMSDHVSREGLVFDFPKSHSIIVDAACTQLSGFVGAQWVAQEYILDKDDIQEIFKVDIGDNYTGYDVNDGTANANATTVANNEKNTDKKGRVRMWEIYAKKEGLVYYIAEGYADFLQEPAPPKVRIKRFYPWFPLVFNEAENENNIYPSSDVSLIRPMQLEYNRSRDGLREHRHANRPATVVAHGALDPDDEKKLASFPRNALLKIKALATGQKIEDVIQVLKRPAIDSALYTTTDIMGDIQLVLGAQEANMGNAGDSTATASGIAESSRMSAISSNIDDLEDMMDELGAAGAEILFIQMDAQTVTNIAGPGAVWPVQTAQEVSNNLYLEVEGGSSGRPNKAVDVANAEKLIPLLMQIPGVSPEAIVNLLVQRLDDKLDPTDFVIDSVQSMVSMNRGAQTAGAGANLAAGDPHMQGPQGGQAPPGAPQGHPGAPAPGAMSPMPGGPKPAPGAVGPTSPSIHSALSGPTPGTQRPNRFVNPSAV